MLTARADNVDRYIVGAIAASALAVASLEFGRRGQDFSVLYVAALAACILLFALCAVALLRGVSRTRRLVRASAAFVDTSAAEKRLQRISAYGSFVALAGIMLQAVHTLFGVPEFTGQWVVSMGALFGGICVQMLAEARYVKTLG